VEGTVIMYADSVTDAMQAALDETNRRRVKQVAYNEAHGIEPLSVIKEMHDLTQRVRKVAEGQSGYVVSPHALPKHELAQLIRDLELDMKRSAAELEFERAALLRDQISELRQTQRLLDDRPEWQRLQEEPAK
jgi:excinuclease ABC subunit B